MALTAKSSTEGQEPPSSPAGDCAIGGGEMRSINPAGNRRHVATESEAEEREGAGPAGCALVFIKSGKCKDNCEVLDDEGDEERDECENKDEGEVEKENDNEATPITTTSEAARQPAPQMDGSAQNQKDTVNANIRRRILLPLLSLGVGLGAAIGVKAAALWRARTVTGPFPRSQWEENGIVVSMSRQSAAHSYAECSSEDDSHCSDRSSSPADFGGPILQARKVAPFQRRDGGEVASGQALEVGLPPEFTATLLDYCEELGITEIMQKYTSMDPLTVGEGVDIIGREDGGEGMWYVHRRALESKSLALQVYPADERTHEAYLHVLARGGFDAVLVSLGKALDVESLVAYQMSFMAGSQGELGLEQTVAPGTNGGVYKLTIPMVLEDTASPLRILRDYFVANRDGDEGYQYRVGTGVLFGKDTSHVDEYCDRRMRLLATVHLAEVNPDNVNSVTETLTQFFPPQHTEWMLAQEARHWQAEGHRAFNKSMMDNQGRRAFRTYDEDDECEKWAEEGLCKNDIETREWCPFSCRVYIQEGPIWVGTADRENEVGVCVQTRTGLEECQAYMDDLSVTGDFAVPKLLPGEMFPIVWREDHTRATPHAFQVGVPPELTSTLLEYSNDLGITDELRRLTGAAPIEAVESEAAARFQKFSDGTEWYVQRPPSKWQSNMHWISPANERTHEEYIKVLAKGNFDLVLDAIGKYLGLNGLVAYQLTYIGVSHSVQGYIHHDTHHTGASVYNVIIPLILIDGSTPELRMTDWENESEAGSLKYRLGTAALMGDSAMHGTEACDYRATGEMRLAATVYIADVQDWNADKIVDQTLTQAFPPKNIDWLMAQAGRHWKNDAGHGREGRTLVNDPGRKSFLFQDMLPECKQLAAEGMCETDIEDTRWECPLSCGVYLLDEDEHGLQSGY